MNKNDFFRKIIIKVEQENVIKDIFSKLDVWEYKGIQNIEGCSYYVLINSNENARVLFKVTNLDYTVSQNVLPIDLGDYNKVKSIYRYGYDMSEVQAEKIQEDILYDLCKEINRHLPANETVYCGIIPAYKDYFL